MKSGVGVVVVGCASMLSLRAAHAQTPPADDTSTPGPNASTPARDASTPDPPAAPVAAPPAPVAAPQPLAAPATPVAPDATPRAATEVAPRVQCETSARKFLNIAFGIGGVSRIGNVPPTYGASFRLQFGQRLAHRFHLVEELSSLLAQSYISAFPTDTSEEHVSLGAGIRWTPSDPRPQPTSGVRYLPVPAPFYDMSALYITALLGVDDRDRVTWVSPTQSTDQSALSPMASLALGIQPIKGHEWSLGGELRGQLTYFDGHVQRSWMVLLMAEVGQW